MFVGGGGPQALPKQLREALRQVLFEGSRALRPVALLLLFRGSASHRAGFEHSRRQLLACHRASPGTGFRKRRVLVPPRRDPSGICAVVPRNRSDRVPPSGGRVPARLELGPVCIRDVLRAGTPTAGFAVGARRARNPTSGMATAL